ncbi:MAG: MFS transporter [Promethearchaeota archaeon]
MKKREYLSLSFFFILVIIIIMDNPLILPNQVLIAADLGIFFDTIGIILGIYTIIHAITIVISGYTTDLFERKKLLIMAGLLWSITAILHIFITELWQLVIARIFAAIATGITAPLIISYIADMVSSESRSKSFAVWSLVSTIGSLFATFFALSFNKIPYERVDIESKSIRENISYISLNFPNLLNTWRYPFLILGIVGLIFTIFGLFLTVEPKRAAKEKFLESILTEDTLQYSYKIKFGDLKNIYKRKSNIFLTLNFFDVIASGLVVAYIFPYFNLELGISFSDFFGILTLGVLLLFVFGFGLIFGQFWLAHLGDKKVRSGDLSGRIKVATICSILTLPFLLGGFIMTPNVANKTFFFGSVSVNLTVFWVLWICFSSLLGIGFAFTFGIAPNWYSALIDVNLPEHKGTVVAMGTFIDFVGRTIGVILGGFIIAWTDSFSLTILWSTLIFGVLSICLWIPLFFTSEKDTNQIREILKERAINIKSQGEIS